MFNGTLIFDGLIAIVLLIGALFGSKGLKKEKNRNIRILIIFSLVLVSCLVLFDLLYAILK